MNASRMSEDGLMYYCRRKYLNAGIGRNNSLQPPKELKTSQQLHREHLQRKEKDNNQNHAEDFSHNNTTQNSGNGGNVLKGIFSTPPIKQSNVPTSNNEKTTSSNRLRKSAHLVVFPSNPESTGVFQNTVESDWFEELRGGVYFYVNKRTGDVTTECPWSPNKTLFRFSNSRLQTRPSSATATAAAPPLRKSDSNTEELAQLWRARGAVELGGGTGSLVYDQQEMQDFLCLLEQAK